MVLFMYCVYKDKDVLLYEAHRVSKASHSGYQGVDL